MLCFAMAANVYIQKTTALSSSGSGNEPLPDTTTISHETTGDGKQGM